MGDAVTEQGTDPTLTKPSAFSLATIAMRRGVVPLAACAIAYGGLLGVEEYAVSKMDVFLTIESMEQAEVTAIAITAISEFLRLSVIGIAIWFLLRILQRDGMVAVRRSFLNLWIGASLVASALVLASNYTGYSAQFGEIVSDPEAFRTLLLGLIYFNMLIYYLFVRTVLGAGIGALSPKGIKSAWLATATLHSIGVLLVVVALKLSLENVAVSMLGFAPFIAPFWFIPDESAPHRYFVGQGTRIVAEAFAVPLFTLLWIWLSGHTVRVTPSNEKPPERA